KIIEGVHVVGVILGGVFNEYLGKLKNRETVKLCRVTRQPGRAQGICGGRQGIDRDVVGNWTKQSDVLALWSLEERTGDSEIALVAKPLNEGIGPLVLSLVIAVGAIGFQSA